jgi:ketosteroid isomerase-like protein
VMSIYAPDILWFDFMAPLQQATADAYRKLWERCFSAYEGAFGAEIRDLSITVGDDVAFGHGLNRLRGTMKQDRNTTSGSDGPRAFLRSTEHG